MDDGHRTILGPGDSYNEVVVQLDGGTGEFHFRNAYYAIQLGVPGGTPPPLPTPWTPGPADNASGE